jgi:hypothetical protein
MVCRGERPNEDTTPPFRSPRGRDLMALGPMQCLTEIPRQTAVAIETAEFEGMAEFIEFVPESYRAQHGVSVIRIGGGIITTFKSLDNPLFNRALGLGLSEPVTEAMIDEILSIYGALGLERFSLAVSPFAIPPELPGWLAARGLTSTIAWAKLWRDHDGLPEAATDLRIEEVGTERADEFAATMLAGFEMPEILLPFCAAVVGRPGWRSYLAYDGDVPVACAGLKLRDGVGWLGSAATLPSHRGRGAQGAMIARRLRDGREAGCRLFTVETGLGTPEKPNASLRNMLRHGFRLAYERPNYRRPEKVG